MGYIGAGITRFNTADELTVTGDATFDTNTLYVDSANNKVGIGTASPTHALTVQYDDQTTTAKFHNANTSGTAIDSANVIIESASRDAGLKITANSSRASFIDFGDEVSATRGRVLYDHSDDSLQIQTSASEAVRIDSSGDAIIGGTTAGAASAVTISGDGYVQARYSSGPAAYFDRLSTDGTIAEFRKDGSSVGSIGAKFSGRSYIASGSSANTGVRFDTNFIAPADATGANRDNAINLGSSGDRFKDLYLSGGAYLGGTGSANYLDDYEEGTFTPNLIGYSGGEATYTYRSGAYTKVGRLVTCQINMTISSVNTISGNVLINTLPFTVADVLSDTTIEASGTVGYLAGLNTSYSSMSCFALSGTTNAEFSGISGTSSTAYSALTNTDITSSFNFRVTISYFTT